jgi:hypothetical protein
MGLSLGVIVYSQAIDQILTVIQIGRYLNVGFPKGSLTYCVHQFLRLRFVSAMITNADPNIESFRTLHMR